MTVSWYFYIQHVKMSRSFPHIDVLWLKFEFMVGVLKTAVRAVLLIE